MARLAHVYMLATFMNINMYTRMVHLSDMTGHANHVV